MVLTVRYICKGHREAFAKTIEGIEKEKRKKKKEGKKKENKNKNKESSLSSPSVGFRGLSWFHH